MRRDEPGSVEDVHFVLRLPHFDSASNERVGNGVAVVVNTNIAHGVDDAVMELVHLGDVERKGFELRTLASKKLSRGCAQVPAELRIGLIAELTCPLIDIGKVLETASGEEVVLDIAHGPLDPCGTIRVTFFVGPKLETKTLGEGLHLGHGNHLLAGPCENNDVGVVDHATLADALEVDKSVGEEQLRVKAIEGGVVLEKEYARIAEHQRCRLNPSELVTDLGSMRRSVVLHLLGRLEVILADGALALVADAVAPAKPCQRRVGQLDVHGHELFVNADQVAATARVETPDFVKIGLGFLRALDVGRLC